MDTPRRHFLIGSTAALATAALSGRLAAAAQATAGTSDAASAFLAAHGGTFDAARRLAFLLPEGLAVVHDVPFPLDHAGYGDHLAFHGESWERLEFMPQQLQTLTVSADNAVVSCYFLERGKPRDAGFRLRAGFATATCVKAAGEWRALSVHFSSLRSQILDASPS
jgi:hypothetical protein